MIHGNSQALRFVTLDTGCYVPISHRLNADGYFRKRWGGKAAPIMEMFHRFIFRAHASLLEIPEGYEVDHICKVRACCNPTHLQLLEGTAHAIASNQDRYAGRKADALTHWKETGCTGTALAAKFGVTFSSACCWIRQWKSCQS